MGCENAHSCAHKAGNGFGFDIFTAIHNDGNEVLSHIIRVAGDETWVSFVNVETKQQSEQWMHTHSPNKLKKFQ
jgi:hypothetical protein